MENQGPKVWTMSDDIAPSESGDAPRKVIAAATRKKQSQQQPQVQSRKWTKTEPKFDVISGWRMKRSEQVEKLLAKPKPEPDFPLSFLGAGEMAKPKPEGPSIAFSKGKCMG